MRILVVEDQRLLRQSIERKLRAEGHAVDDVGTIADALDTTEMNPYDLVILDRGLPDGDGVDALLAWRERGERFAVLILTAYDAVPRRVEGLEAGADDYLVKPFEMAELLARVRALSRRAGDLRDVILRVGDLELDTARAEVRRAGILMPLRAKELAVLQVLMKRRGRVVSRGQLRDACWDDAADIESNVEEAAVSALRRKLGAPPIIQTRRGLGYVIED